MCVQFQSQFSDFLENLLLSWTMYRPLYYRLCTVQSSSLHCKLFTRHRTLNSVQCSLSQLAKTIYFSFFNYLYFNIYFFLFYRLLRFTNTYLLIDISCLFIFNEDSSCTFLVKKFFYSLSLVIYLFLTSSPSSHFFSLHLCTKILLYIFMKMHLYKDEDVQTFVYIFFRLYLSIFILG